MRSHARALTASLLTIISMMACSASAQEAPPERRSLTPPERERILAPATKPLDERVDASKITEFDPPALPEWVMLPLPPEFRVAKTPARAGVDAERFERGARSIERGLTFLRQSQSPRGLWGEGQLATPTDEPEKPSPVVIAISAMAVKAFAQSGVGPDDPVIAKALHAILAAQREDGAFEGGALTNYVTSITVSALAAMEVETLRTPIDRAVVWLQSNQWDQTEGIDPKLDWFGGAGYGNRGRPDLSNTQLMMDALYDAGLSPDEPAFQKALAFLSRAQNLRATNSADWSSNDGGFIYTPSNGGESFASELAGEGRHGEHIPEGDFRSLRSYGSMTYAGFKGLLYAGLSQDDVRVRAAFDWMRRHFTFEENPGLGQHGLYYYYHAMARALRIAQQTTITDINGGEHHWRHEMIDAIVKRQMNEGAWRNEHDRWMEGDADLVTAYALLSLQEVLKPRTSD